mmetsp:Transcript_40333/g.112008  ORF Transcript_40333/g.112008 Transcript_40333/m.112008 type:complete len:205 (+) Transcript_40333:614-1228(+)
MQPKPLPTSAIGVQPLLGFLCQLADGINLLRPSAIRLGLQPSMHISGHVPDSLGVHSVQAVCEEEERVASNEGGHVLGDGAPHQYGMHQGIGPQGLGASRPRPVPVAWLSEGQEAQGSGSQLPQQEKHSADVSLPLPAQTRGRSPIIISLVPKERVQEMVDLRVCRMRLPKNPTVQAHHMEVHCKDADWEIVVRRRLQELIDDA